MATAWYSRLGQKLVTLPQAVFETTKAIVKLGRDELCTFDRERMSEERTMRRLDGTVRGAPWRSLYDAADPATLLPLRIEIVMVDCKANAPMHLCKCIDDARAAALARLREGPLQRRFRRGLDRREEPGTDDDRDDRDDRGDDARAEHSQPLAPTAREGGGATYKSSLHPSHAETNDEDRRLRGCRLPTPFEGSLMRTAAILGLLTTLFAGTEDRVREIEPPLETRTFERWRAFIHPKPDELSFERIDWHNSVWSGLAKAQREGKPLLIWIMNGHPCGLT